jgi:predicted RNase H-like HicB family nuclease
MPCTLLIEQIESRWIAHVYELPGCFASGDTSQNAIVGSAPATAIWQEWLAEHGLAVPGNTGPLTTTIAEIVRAWNSSPEYEVNAFFALDRPALKKAEIERALQILEFTRRDLLAAVEGLTPAQLDQPVEEDWNIRKILRHTARAEHWYLDRLDLAKPKSELPEDTFACLNFVRDHFRATLPSLAGDDRLLIKDYELWSPRKLLRRALWHERDHIDHALQFRQKLGA